MGAGVFKFVSLAVDTTKCLLLLSALLNPCLSLLCFYQQLLLVLLLAETVKELVRLSHDLRHKCVLVVVFDIEDLSTHFVVLLCCLVNIADQVFILDVNSPEFFVVINPDIILWWLLRSDHLVHVDSTNFVWR